MSEPTLDEIAAAVERLSDDSARLIQGQLMDRLDPYRAGAGSASGMVAGATPLNVARLIAAGVVTADTIAAGAITADKLTVGGIGGGNICTNGSFESGALGWNLSGAGPPHIDVRTSPAGFHFDGAASVGFYSHGTAEYVTGPTGVASFTFHNGVRYVASVWANDQGTSAVSASGLGLVMEGTTAVSGSIITERGSASGTTPYTLSSALSGGWNRLWVSWVQNGDQTGRYVLLTPSYGGTYTNEIYMDAVQVEVGAIPTAFASGPDFRNSTGDVVIDSSGITINNGALTFNDETGSTMLDASGFGITWSKYITSGFYNSDFSSAPPTPASELNNTTNRLPGWSVTKLSGTAISCKSIAFSAAPSGRVVEFTVASGSTSDSTELSQMVPVFGAYGQSLTYTLTVVVKNNGTALPSGLALWVYAQGYEADGVTTTGSLTSYGVISGALNALDIFTQRLSVPSDAGYMDVMVRLVRTGSASLTGSINVVGLGLVGTPGGLYLSESSDLTSREVGMVKQVGGELVLNGGYDTSGAGEIKVAGGSTGGITMLPGSAGTDHLGQLRSNESYLPYQMEVLTCSVTLSSAAAAYTDVTWVSGRFDVAPIVFVTMASAAGGSGKFVARAISTTTSGSRIYVYTGDQTSQSASVTVDVLALQMRGSAADG